MRKFWRKIKWLVYLAIIIAVADALLIVSFAYVRPTIPKADAIIVLGAAINSKALVERSLEGLKLYQSGKAKEMVLSGGRISDQDLSEAQFMRNTIVKNAVLPPKMILEQNSHSTYENIKYSKIAIPDAQTVIIVTDRYHIARAVLLAKERFKNVYWASPSTSYYPRIDLLKYYGREMLAMVAYIPHFLVK